MAASMAGQAPPQLKLQAIVKGLINSKLVSHAR